MKLTFFILPPTLPSVSLKNHPYSDGNQGTALLAADMYGYRLQEVPL